MTAAAAAWSSTTPARSATAAGGPLSTRTVNARIPAGVRDGQRIRLKGKGAPGERGGPAGDLYIVVHVQPHPLFGRASDNLTLTLPVTFPEVALGAQVSVPTLRRSGGDAEDPGGHRGRPDLPGQGQGRRRGATARAATCW